MYNDYMKKILPITFIVTTILSISILWWPLDGYIKNNVFELYSYETPFQMSKELLSDINVIFYTTIATLVISLLGLTTWGVWVINKKKVAKLKMIILLEAVISISALIISIILWILVK